MRQVGSATPRLLRAADRLMPALLMAASVTLLAAGFLWYGSPGATGSDEAYAAVRPPASAAPQADPGAFARSTAAPAGATEAATLGPSTSASGSATPARSPATPLPNGSSAPVAVATRIAIPSLEIDLPIISRDLVIPNQGPAQYPPCDVAIFHSAFGQPGQAGATYLYAHARPGMFLPLLTASEQRNGASMLGSIVEVYTDDNHRYVYTITLVKRHATDFSIADAAPGRSVLVLQTSEGPRGTIPKLQVLAQLQDVLPAAPPDAHPKPRPRACYQ